MGTRVEGSHEGAGWHMGVRDGKGKGARVQLRGGVVRSSAVKRFAAWECEDAEVNNSLTYHKHAP